MGLRALLQNVVEVGKGNRFGHPSELWGKSLRMYFCPEQVINLESKDEVVLWQRRIFVEIVAAAVDKHPLI